MGRVAVVTGGTAGVGRAVVDQLIARGYRVGALARGEDRLEELQTIHGRDRVLGISCDVGDAGAVSQAAREVHDEFGPPTVWVNDAMLTSYSPFRQMPSEEFEAIVRATFLGQVNGTRAALAVMERGHIVNIGSALSYRGLPMQSAYVAAKHAINGFTQSLRSELMREGVPITLSLVQLPAVNTPQFDWARNRLPEHPQPAPPVYQPEVAAGAVMKAIDRGNREIFVGVSTMQLVLGNFVMPWFLDRKLARRGAQMQQIDRPDPHRGGNIAAPVPMRSSAHGSFDDRARTSGLVLDADRTRLAAFLGVPLATFAAGMLMSGLRRRAGPRLAPSDREKARPRALDRR